MKNAAEPKTQIDKFKALAKELGADQTEEQFAETVRKIAKAPKPKPKNDE